MLFLHVDLCQNHLVISFRTQRETISTTLLSLAAEVYKQHENLRPKEYMNYKQTIQSYIKMCLGHLSFPLWT